MARKLIPTLSLALTAGLIAASPAAAATVTECSQLDGALESGDNIVTIAQGLDCTGSWDLPSREILLEGAGTGATLRGDGESRILEGNDVGLTTISNLRFVGGDGGRDGGGAILIGGDSPITIFGSEFEDNDASGRGGAVALYFEGSGQNDRARSARLGDVPTVSIVDSLFAGNESDSEGGAVFLSADFPVRVEGSTFEENAAGGDGGGAASLFSFSGVTLDGNTVTGNRATRTGGGMRIELCETATLTGNVFSGNTVQPLQVSNRTAALGAQGGRVEGGGIWLGGGCWMGGEDEVLKGMRLGKLPENEVEQEDNLFEANELAAGVEGFGSGGGEYISDAALTSTGDVFNANTLTGSGASGSGGGLNVDAWSGEPFSARNLVAGANRIDGDGAGINYATDTSAGGSVSLVHATIAANDGGEGDGAGLDGGEDDSLVLHNSIFHGNIGAEELNGFQLDPGVAGRLSDPAGTRDVRFTLLCEGGEAHDGDGNLCADAKLANAAGGDVHQTAASPSLETASGDLSAGLTEDYEGDGRALDHDRSGAAEPDMGADEKPAPPVEQPTTQQQQPAPAATGGVAGTQARSCVSKRSFRIRLRTRGQKVNKATVIVNGKRVKVLRGKRLTSHVNLRGLPKGRFAVRIVLRLANGKVVSGTRRYRTCVPGRRSGPPPV